MGPDAAARRWRCSGRKGSGAAGLLLAAMAALAPHGSRPALFVLPSRLASRCPAGTRAKDRSGRTSAAAAPPSGAAAPAAAAESWRGHLRTLLLSRSGARRLAALKQLQAALEGEGGSVFAEVEAQGEAIERGSWRDRVRLRPLVGYRSACASLYRTMVQHVMPEQAGTSVEVQRRDNGVRYVLRDDAMDGTTEGQAAVERPDDEEFSSEEQKARALSVVLRQLAESSAWEVERAAAAGRGVEGDSSSDKWLARTPDLETPRYEVLQKDPAGVFEVRRYDPYSVVRMSAGADRNGTKSFFALAGYIFGKSNTAQEKMAMTTPVQTDRDSGLMSFIMPSRYWGDEKLLAAPPPSEEATVELIPVPEEVVAVTVFGGYARNGVIAAKTQALLDAIGVTEGVEVVNAGRTRLMQYNDPFTVPWKRRNEVAVPVRLAA